MARRAPVYQIVSLARIDSGLTALSSSRASRLVLEHVPDAAHGVQEPPLSLFFDPPAEIADVDVDHVALGVEVEPPDMLGQHGPGEHAAGFAQEVLEQRVLAGRQFDPPATTPDFASARVESKVGQPEHGRGPAPA